MRRTTKLASPSMGLQSLRGAWQRLSMSLMLVMLTTMTAWAEKKIVVFSDPHVMAEELLVSDGTAWQTYLNGQRKMVDHSKQLFDEMITQLKTDKPNLVLIPGDLTKDGEQLSHQYVVGKLDELRTLGIKVLVIPGNHDCGANANAVYYDGDNTSPADVADNAWFATNYANYGYGTGSERESTSLTYACEPLNGLVVIGIDSGTDGVVSSTTLDWITTKAAAAKTSGKCVIAMMHHPLIPHFTGVDTFVETAVVSNYETVRNTLADASINMVFTGHFHTSDIAKDWNDDKTKEIYDVNTGSLISYPCDYREVTMSDNFLTMSITTGHISTIDDAEDRLHTAVKNAITAQGGAYALIAETAADAFIIHAEGNEQDNDNSTAIISTFEADADLGVTYHQLSEKQATALKAMAKSMLQDKSNYGNEEREDVTNDLTLNLQWTKSLATCTVSVPNQTLEGPNNPFENINYKFEYANNNYSESYAQDFIAKMGVVVKDGDNTLALGTDYLFGSVTKANGDPITESQIGDECKVEIVGMGAYDGTVSVPFTIISPSANGTHGGLSWSLADGTLSITGTGAMTAAATSAYPWYNYCSLITNISIGEGITSIADNAFGSTSNIYTYNNVTKVTIPSTVTSIGADVFKGCISATDVYCCAHPENLTWGDMGDDFKSDGSTVCHVADASAWSGFSNVHVTFVGNLADVSIPYIDANGNTTYCTNYTVLKTNELPDGCSYWGDLPGGWYVVENWNVPTHNEDEEQNDPGDFELNIGSLGFQGDAHLILCDGATMNISNTNECISSTGTLNIYGQTNGTGTLNANNYDGYTVAAIISDHGIIINGGTVNATNAATEDYYAIVTSFGDLTINGGTVTATAGGTAYALYGFNVSILGGNVTANGTVGTWSGEGRGTITLGWRTAGDRIKVKSYECTTVKVKDGQTFKDDSDNFFSSTITDVSTFAGKTLMPTVPYLDASGNTAYCTDFTVLTGNETQLAEINQEDGCDGWYVVTGKVTYSAGLKIEGHNDDVNLILCDGAEMSLSGYEYAFGVSGYHFNIYGQTNGTGKVVTTNSECGIYASVCSGDGYSPTLPGSFTIYGGNIEATGEYYGINVYGGAITINGGTIEATGDYYGILNYEGDVNIFGGIVTVSGYDGISNDGNITLGWSNASDRITVSSFATWGEIIIADGKSFYNGEIIIPTGKVDNRGKLEGKTLIGVDVLNDAAENDITALKTRLDGKETNVVLNGRTLTKDGNWNTLCLPFDLGDPDASTNHWFDDTPLEGATVMTLGNSQACNTGLNAQTGTLNLEFLPADCIEAGVPYIVKWTKPSTYVPYVDPDTNLDAYNAWLAADPANRDIHNPVFTGVTVSSDEPTAVKSYDNKVAFVGQYSPFSIGDTSSGTFDGDINEIIMLGSGSTLGYSQNPRTLKCFRAHFYVRADGGVQQARAFVVDFGEGDGETTGIMSTTDFTDYTEKSDAWYNLDGRKLGGQPTKKGVYIKNGRKIVIK